MIADVGCDIDRSAAADSCHHALDQAETALVESPEQEKLMVDCLVEVEDDPSSVDLPFFVARGELHRTTCPFISALGKSYEEATLSFLCWLFYDLKKAMHWDRPVRLWQ